MKELNAYTIQERIRKQDFVSILWIQTEFGLNYKEAKGFLAQFQKRGWVSKNSENFLYEVQKENCRLRFITKIEVETLYEMISSRSVKALQCMQERDGAGEMAMRRITHDDDEVLELLQELDLCYFYDGLYFSCVSKKTVDVLEKMVEYKRHRSLRKSLGTKEDDSALWAIFAALFEDL